MNMIKRRFERCVLWLPILLLSLLALMPYQTLHAEGSWQMGLFEGLSYRQPMRESTGTRNFLSVDILAAGEVINVLACGTNNTHELRILVQDPGGSWVYDNTAVSNVDCDDDFNRTFDPVATNAHQYVTPSAGTYKVYFLNEDGTNLNRFDITVTDSLTEEIDPRENGGRVWTDYWYFAAGAFTENRSTDADLYVVADGGFTDTYFIWKLDLTNFAGHGYGLKANSLGVQSPNAAGDVVAGISVPRSGNQLVQQYPIYLSYPAKNYPEPGEGVGVSELIFQDSTTTDNAITSTGSGVFTFDAELTTNGVYEIIIDNGDPSGGPPDGEYAQGDIYLRGVASPGTNTVAWDGKDNNGDEIPLGVYNARLSLRTGEFHFVADDVETSGGPGNPGIRIYKVNSDGTDSPTTVYWDDFTVLGSTRPDAFNQTGIYEGDHNWGTFVGNGFGDARYIDTYSFGASVSPNPTPVAVVDDDTVLIGIEKTFLPDSIAQGDSTEMQFEIGYAGTVPQTGINLIDNLPYGMILVSDPASITVTGTGCSGFTFGPDTVAGGDVLSIVDGNMDPDSVCIVSAQVTGLQVGELVNQTSGVTSNENSFGVPSNYETLFVTPATSGTPFVCDANFYEMENVGSSTRLYNIDTSVDAYTRTEFSGIDYSPSTSFRYNGLAYNPNDNYLYGIVTHSDNALGDPAVGSIVRIDQEGKVVDLGLPEQGPNVMTMPEVSDRFVGGTMTAAGNYVVVTDNTPTSHTGDVIPAEELGLVLEIDISVFPPQVLFNWQHNLDVGDIYAHPDGNLISHAPDEGYVSIDSETGDVVVLGGDEGATYSSLVSTPSAKVHIGSSASTADGASCAYGLGFEKLVSAIEVEPGNSVTYELEVVNGGNAAVTFDLLDDLQDTRTYVADSLVNTLGGTVNAYGDASVLSITGATLAANSSATLSFDVMYPTGYSGGPSSNQAQIQVSGMSPVLSDNPSTPRIGDATPIEVLISSAIGVSKSADVAGAQVTYRFNIVNTGAGELGELSLSDNLDAVFGAGNYNVVTPPVLEVDPGTITLNASFDGATDAVIIDAASDSTLAEGARAVVRLSIQVTTVSDVGLGLGVYSNQVDIFANALSITDKSVDGDNVDPNGDDLADEESPTVVSLLGAASVSGVVFEDNGAFATAHDAVQEGGEKSLGGVTVELRDSGGVLIGSMITGGDGRYEIAIPEALDTSTMQVVALAKAGYQAISEASDSGVTGSVVDNSVSFTPDFATSLKYQIDFGRIKQPSWLKNNVAENSPGAVVLHPHQYRANTSGQLSFSFIQQSSHPANPDYSAVLFLDENCNGAIDNSEQVVPDTLAVTVSSAVDSNCDYSDAAANGGRGFNPITSSRDYCPPIAPGDDHLVCIINKVLIPSNTSNDATYQTRISATFEYADPLLSSHGVSSFLELTDITRTVVVGEGVLVLSKSVSNVSTGTSVTTRNVALPDDVLRYNVTFSNNGTGPVSEVTIGDSTPAFTVLEDPVQCPPTLPDGIVACQVLTPTGASNSAGYTGALRWGFDGTLPAGSGGSVSFDIRVE